MARKRPCLDCKRLTHFSRCEECGKAHTRKRDLQRGQGEPWREVYGTAAWKRARSVILNSAAYRCQVTVYTVDHPDGRRCLKPAQDVHHVRKLRDLWREGKDPCDTRYLVATCRTCHRILEGDLEGDPLPPPPRAA